MPRITAISKNNYLKDKSIKKLLKIALWSLVSIFVLTVLLLFSLQFAAVQTYLTQRVADFLGKELQAKITLEKVFFKPFSDRKSTRLNSSHVKISYAVFCLKK